MSTATMPEYSSQVSESQMHLTPPAEAKMAELMADADADIRAIRVFVSGGGCSGLTYGMTYAEGPTPYDSVLEGEGFKIVVDPVAMGYLQGCEVDFHQKGLGASFVFNNVFQSVGGSGVCGGCGGAGGGGGCGSGF